MARRRPRSLLGATGLDDQDGLLAADPLGDFGEVAGVAERLEIHADDAGLVVVFPVFEQVVAGDVGLVADRGELGEADAEVRRGVEDGHAERSGLADEADRAAARRRRCEGRVHRHAAGSALMTPMQFGADHAHARPADLVAQLALESGTLGSGLGEAGGDNDEALDAGGDALVDDRQDDVCEARR